MIAVSGEPGTIARPSTAKVTAEVVGDGRGDKILVFHLKRKKQYKKLQGHRQNFTEVRIKAIEADGVTYGGEVARRQLQPPVPVRGFSSRSRAQDRCEKRS